MADSTDARHASIQGLLSGWGGAIRTRAEIRRPEHIPALRGAARSAGSRGVIARGLGRSYGDQATNAGGLVIDTTDIGRAPGRVPSDGVVRLGPGVSIETLLADIVPQGWFVPVTPGTRQVTMGGAIAADVHGKDHHVHGSIGSCVERIEVLTAGDELVTCSASVRPDLYWATVGGLGLTGVVTSIDLRLVPIETSRMLVDTSRLVDLEALMSAMVEADRTATYSVAWIDLMAEGRNLGRSVLTTADFARVRDFGAVDRDDLLGYDQGRRIPTPPVMPNGLVNPLTVQAFNEAWFRKAPRRRVGEVQSIPQFFHPLDGVQRWNRVYGSRGFVQWQVVVPDGADLVLRGVVERLASSGVPSFLAVLKRFGDANPGPLSFPMRGWTLAADFPVGGRALAPLLDELDGTVADAGGRVYLAKDARIDPAMVARMYPRLDEWRAVRAAFDPNHRWQSDLSRRLGLA